MSKPSPWLAAFLMSFAPLAATAASLPQPAAPAASPDIIEVYGGCGPYAHRGPAGYCRTGGQAGGYVPGFSCPPGFHIGPYGRHCFPN